VCPASDRSQLLLNKSSVLLYVLCSGSRDLAKRHCHWLQEQLDLSYLNGPEILAMVLEADYEGIDKVQQIWSIIEPPQECILLMFPKVNGLTMVEVIEELRKVGSAPAAGVCCQMIFFFRIYIV
jgi:hypothetical protein